MNSTMIWDTFVAFHKVMVANFRKLLKITPGPKVTTFFVEPYDLVLVNHSLLKYTDCSFCLNYEALYRAPKLPQRTESNHPS